MGGGASITALPFDPNVFPKLGVKLSYLDKFFKHCGGRQCLEGLTTTEVNERFVIPMTQESQSSVCDLLVHNKDKDEEGHAAVGIANVFISHAWKFKFLDVVDALVAHFKDEDNDNKNVIIWLDLFSNNQHKAVDLTFHYWSNTFKSAIDSFGHTIMVLSPWNDPIPLTRAWCLWELYCTVDTESKFEIAMTQPSRNQFIEDILNDPRGEINKMLGTINVERSECFKESDRESIFEAIRLSVGFSELNSLVFERFREWVISSMEEETNSCEESERYPEYLKSLGELHRGQGNYEKAEPLLKKSYSLSVERLGESHPDTLKSMNNLAILYDDQGKYNEAEELSRRCFELRKQTLGETHPDTINSMNNLANLYSDQGKYHEAEEMSKRCLELDKQILGETNPRTLISMNTLAALYYGQGKYNEAEVLYQRCFELRKQMLGETHPHTLTSLNNLAILYSDQGKYTEAEELSRRCLELSKQMLGDNHPHTLTSMNNLAALYYGQGKYNDAEELYKRCLELYKQILRETHPDSVRSMNNLALLYSDQGRYHEAEELYKRCFELRKQMLGEDHPHTLTSMNSLADLYSDQGKYNEADKLRNEMNGK